MNKEFKSKFVTYIAEPSDHRCQFWASVIPEIGISGITEKVNLKYLRSGTDLELETKTFIIESESNHHRKSRGYLVRLGLVFEDDIKWLKPNREIKAYIKSKGNDDLMAGSGEVTAVMRCVLFLRRQENMFLEFNKLKELE